MKTYIVLRDKIVSHVGDHWQLPKYTVLQVDSVEDSTWICEHVVTVNGEETVRSFPVGFDEADLVRTPLELAKHIADYIETATGTRPSVETHEDEGWMNVFHDGITVGVLWDNSEVFTVAYDVGLHVYYPGTRYDQPDEDYHTRKEHMGLLYHEVPGAVLVVALEEAEGARQEAEAETALAEELERLKEYEQDARDIAAEQARERFERDEDQYYIDSDLAYDVWREDRAFGKR